MGRTEHSQAKIDVVPTAAPPQVSPFQNRGFGDQVEAEQQTESSLESTPLQARLDRASRLGHNFNHVQVLSQAPTIQRQAAEPEEDEIARMKPDLQMAGGAGEADPELESSIQSARGGGQTLDSGVRQSMEGAFGADFRGVRIHTDSRADSLNRSIHAQAFTTGQDVFFRSGSYDPGSSSGKHLLAHELTHVVQQSGSQVSRPQAKLTIGEPGDAYEQEADATAAQVVQRIESEEQVQRQPQVQAKPASSRVQRQQITPTPPRVQRQDTGARPAPPTSGPLTAGGIDVRRINPNQIDALIQAMQTTAEQRGGYGGFSDSRPSLEGSGVATRLRTFLNDVESVKRGMFDSGWGNDNSGDSMVGAWNYRMRVRITSIHYNSPTQEGIANPTGTHDSTGGNSSTNQVTDGSSQTNSTSVEGTGTGNVGGHEGAPGLEGGGTVGAGQSDTESNQTGTTRTGSENFDREATAYDRYNADLVAHYNIAFEPGRTLGFISNTHMEAQNFNGSHPFGTVIFDYTAL